MNTKFILFLCNQKGYIVLNELLNKGFSSYVELVVCAEDKDVSKDYFQEIRNLCEMNGLNSIDRKLYVEKENSYTKIAIGWRWLMKNTDNLIVLHDSILPKYRGFAPLVSMLINGEREIGVTAIFASEGFDEGDIIDQISIKINYPILIKEAIQKVSNLYAEIVCKIFNNLIENGRLDSRPQNHENATYSLWRDFDDYKIDWTWDSLKIKRFIDAIGFPYLGAMTYVQTERLIILNSEVVPDIQIENRNCGKIIRIDDNLYPVVVCGSGLIRLTKIIKEDGSSALPFNRLRIKFK